MADPAKAPAPRIEGGIDAIVLGSNDDGLAAAALLARHGFSVVLIESGERQARAPIELAAGLVAERGAPIVSDLDHAVVEMLDLYRHGLSFVERRLETAIRFADGSLLELGSDPSLAAEGVARFAPEDSAAFGAFLEQQRARARLLADWFAGGERPALDADANLSARNSVDGEIAGRFADPRLEDYLGAEAAFGAAALPSEPYTFFAFVSRLSGEIAGLQGASAIIENGARGLSNALRRAAQSAGVVFRQTDRVTRIIVEWDRVAGVAFDDGAQVRAPVIISALPASETFLGLVGRERLDIEFAHALDAPSGAVGTARFHAVLAGAGAASEIARDFRRRFLFAPSRIDCERAWRAARAGLAPAMPIAELVFPSAFSSEQSAGVDFTVSIATHPAPVPVLPASAVDEAALIDAARAVIGRITGGGAISNLQLESIEAAAPPILAAIAQRDVLVGGVGLGGYFFCGREARIANPANLSAGRRAADRARAFLRDHGGG